MNGAKKPLLLFLFFAFLLPGAGKYAISATYEAEYPPFRLYETAAMQFGMIIAPRHGQAVIKIDPRTGSRRGNGPYDFGGHAGPALFEVEAEPGAEFTLYVPRHAVARSGTAEAEIRNIQVHPKGILKAGQDGRLQFAVGGTLVIPAGLASGDYRAEIPVRLDRVAGP